MLPVFHLVMRIDDQCQLLNCRLDMPADAWHAIAACRHDMWPASLQDRRDNHMAQLTCLLDVS